MPSASSAMAPEKEKSPEIPSDPILVVTAGVPFFIASINLPFKPAPKRKGAKQTLAFFITSETFAIQPLIKKPSFFECNSKIC